MNNEEKEQETVITPETEAEKDTAAETAAEEATGEETVEDGEEIAEADNQRMKELADAAQVVQNAQDALKAEKQNLETVKAELDAAQATLNQKKEDSNKLLQELLSELQKKDSRKIMLRCLLL